MHLFSCKGNSLLLFFTCVIIICAKLRIDKVPAYALTLQAPCLLSPLQLNPPEKIVDKISGMQLEK